MTEKELRLLVREQILTRFKEKMLVEQSVKSTASGTKKIGVNKERRIREQTEKEVNDDIMKLSDMMSDQIDDELNGVIQQADRLAKSAGTGKKTNEIGVFAAVIAFPAVVELIAKVIQVIGFGIKKIVAWWTGKEGKGQNEVQKIGKAIEHWVEHSILAKGYYRAIGYVIKGLIEGSAKGILKAIDKMEGRDTKDFDKDTPYFGTTTGPIARAAQAVLRESDKTDYIKVGGWIFKAISLAAVTNGLKEAISNWKEISSSVAHVLHVAVEAFEAAKMTSSAGDVLLGLLAAGGGTFAVFSAYKKLSELFGGYEKLSNVATGEEKLNAANLDVEMQKQSAAMAA